MSGYVGLREDARLGAHLAVQIARLFPRPSARAWQARPYQPIAPEQRPSDKPDGR